DSGLSVLCEKSAQAIAEVGDEAKVRDEQYKVSDGQAAAAYAASRQQHDQPCANTDCVGGHGFEQLSHHAIDQHGPASLLIQATETSDHSVLCAACLHCLHGGQQVADSAGDLTGGLATGLAVTGQHGACLPHCCRDQHQWQQCN